MTKRADLDQELSTSSSARVFWDAFGIDQPYSGIHRYATNLWRGLREYDVHPTIVTFANSSTFTKDATILNISTGRFYQQVPLGKLGHAWAMGKTLTALNARLPKRKVFHGHSNCNIPGDRAFHRHWSTVLTIHDLIPLLSPKDVSFAYYAQMRTFLRFFVERVQQLVFVSEWTKNCFNDLVPQYKGGMDVVPNGCPVLDIQPLPAFQGRWHVLSVGRHESYKNLDMILDVLREQPDVDFTLVTDAWGVKDFSQRAAREIGQGRLTLRQGLDEAAMRAEYVKAHIYFHPSRFEGFGLPLIEALAVGRPVVYQRGHGFDDYAPKPYAFGVGRDATIADWCQAINQAKHLATEAATNPAVFNAERLKLPTVSAQAMKISKIYDNLLK